MGIRDVFLGKPSNETGPAPSGVSSPLDVDDQGPVTLSDRRVPGAQGSPDTNQGKTEPLPATPGDPDPTAPVPAPSLADMNVGAGDPQAPSHPAARDRDVGDAGSLAGGIVQADPGRAQRAPGSMGVSEEEQHTDLAAGAQRMRTDQADVTPPPVEPGDSQGVSVPNDQPSPGTSEQQPIVTGTRLPEPGQRPD